VDRAESRDFLLPPYYCNTVILFQSLLNREMALFDRDLNAIGDVGERGVRAHFCDAGNDQTRKMARLASTTAQLEKDLRAIEARLEQRLGAVRAGDSFRRDSAVDVVREFSDLEEDRFWRDEIATRLQEHLDELHARQALCKDQQDARARSSESSPARRDAAYALKVYTADREFEIATRRKLDGDEMSEAYAATLQKREEALAEAERNAATQGEKTNVRMIGRLFAKLRGSRSRNSGQRQRK